MYFRAINIPSVELARFEAFHTCSTLLYTYQSNFPHCVAASSPIRGTPCLQDDPNHRAHVICRFAVVRVGHHQTIKPSNHQTITPSTSKGAHTAKPMMSASKSESYIPIARTKAGLRLPTVKSSTNLVALASSNKTPIRRGRLRELRLPPPGGYQNAA